MVSNLPSGTTNAAYTTTNYATFMYNALTCSYNVRENCIAINTTKLQNGFTDLHKNCVKTYILYCHTLKRLYRDNI